MRPTLPPLRLVGAKVLVDGALQDGAVGFADGVIGEGRQGEVDLSGYLVLPGIVDLHGDGFERHIAPRPSAAFPMEAGLASADREAAANGVTTAFFAQGWSWEGAHRSPDHAVALLEALDAYRDWALTDIRVQIRAENHLIDAGPRLIATVRKHGVGYVVFNDHLSEGFEAAAERPANFIQWAHKIGQTPAALLRILEEAKLRGHEVPRHLCTLAAAFDEMGVIFGSHDDAEPETRERFAMIGARIAEFPTTLAVAMTARAADCPVIMGAPNVVRGSSQAGNVSAMHLIAEGLCDVLVSDYHIPALPLAAFALADRGLLDLAAAWALISTNAARVIKLGDRGRIAAGLRADLAIVNATTRTIEATIAGGRMAYLSGEAAGRFLSAAQAMPLAAE